MAGVAREISETAIAVIKKVIEEIQSAVFINLTERIIGREEAAIVGLNQIKPLEARFKG